MKIIVYGIHSNEWNIALSNESQIWEKLGTKDLIVRILTRDKLNDYINKSNEDKLIFIPLMEQHFYIIYSCRNYLYELNFPSYEIFKSFHNKKSFENFTIENKLEKYVPKKYRHDEPIFPLITKKSYNNSGVDSKIYHSMDEYLLDIHRENDVFQEYIIESSEYVSHLVVNRGRIIKELSFEYVFETEFYIKGVKDSPKKFLNYNPAEWVVDILSKFLVNYHGVCNIDYKVSRNNVYVMEINPRLGGSLMNNLEDLTEIVGSWLSITE